MRYRNPAEFYGKGGTISVGTGMDNNGRYTSIAYNLSDGKSKKNKRNKNFVISNKWSMQLKNHKEHHL